MGVRAAMPIAQASEMARYGGAIFTSEHDPDLDRQALEQIAGDLQQNITPLVSIEKLDKQTWDGRDLHQPQAFLCDITGIDHLFGGEAGLIKAAKRRLELIGVFGRMAIASNAQTAWSLAHFHDDETVFPTVNDAGCMKILNSLPVQAMRIPPTTTATLSRLGVGTIGALLGLPRDGLATRLGTKLVDRICQLLGEVDEPLPMYRASAEYTSNLALEYPTADPAILQNRIGKLIDEVKVGLSTDKRGALRLACQLTLVDHRPLTFEVGFFAPTCDTQHILGLVLRIIEERKLPAPVSDICVNIPLTAPLSSSQNSLFENDQATPASLSRMVDSLSGRLGRESVLGVKRSDNPLPEKSHELYPLTGQSPKLRRSLQDQPANTTSQPQSEHANMHFRPSANDAMRRPVTLLASPLPLHPMNETAADELPASFRQGGKIHEITRYWGPEKIETGWWHGPSIRRDYYRIETNQGVWWWVYRNLIPDKNAKEPHRRHTWMLHGKFS